MSRGLLGCTGRQKYTVLESTLPINLIMSAPGDKVNTLDTIVFVHVLCIIYIIVVVLLYQVNKYNSAF